MPDNTYNNSYNYAANPFIYTDTADGTRRLTIYDNMLARRELSVAGSIDAAMAFSLCHYLRYLEQQDPQTPVTVFVSSSGGEVAAGLAIYDALRTISCPITTVCTDRAMSMGSIVFMAGEERLMYPHAELLIHDPLIPTGAGGSACAVQEVSRQLMRVRRTLNTILAERSGLSLKRVQQMTGNETRLPAGRAVELGFATSTISSRKVA